MRSDQAQQIKNLFDFAEGLQDEQEENIETIWELRDEVRVLQEQLHHANTTIAHQREDSLREHKAWMAFSSRHCCDHFSTMLSNFVQTRLQVDLIDRIIFSEIKNFLGFSGVEPGLEDNQAVYAKFYVLFGNGNVRYVKWNLDDTLYLGYVSWEEHDKLHEKANVASNLIPLEYRQWFKAVGCCDKLMISFDSVSDENMYVV